MRSRPVAVIAVSLLLIAGATGFQVRGQILHLLGADRPIPGSAPEAIGNKWDCSSGWLKAYQSGMVYYPSYHPAPPPLGMKPTRCYRNASEAKSAGFKLAPAPAGGALLDGVYLVPAGAQTKTECQAAATQLGIAIPCPTLQPNGPDSLCSLSPRCMLPYYPGPRRQGADAERVGGFGVLFMLTTPPDYPGAQAVGFAFGQVQIGIQALLSSSPVAQLNDKVCTPGDVGPTVMGRPTLWSTCGSPPAGSVNLTWKFDNASYAVGSSDQTPVARRMVLFFASKLVPVSPISG